MIANVLSRSKTSDSNSEYERDEARTVPHCSYNLGRQGRGEPSWAPCTKDGYAVEKEGTVLSDTQAGEQRHLPFLLFPSLFPHSLDFRTGRRLKGF